MEKDFLKDGMDNLKITEIIKKIRKTIEITNNTSYDDKIIYLKSEYNEFEQRYPILFDMATRETPFDWNFFNYFMNMRNKIINDELTSEKASVIVGQNAFDKYMNNDIKGDSSKKRKI